MKIIGARTSDITLEPEHELFRRSTGAVTVTLQVRWVPVLRPTGQKSLFDSGTTWRLYKREDGFQFDFGPRLPSCPVYRRLSVDEHFQQAVLEMSEEHFTVYPEAAAPLAYPLDELLITHRLTQERAIELHGCGIVGPDNMTNLFVGHSGAGKSTTAHLWTQMEDVEILSDDRIIVRYGPAAGNGSNREIRMYGTPWHGEGQFASPASAPLQRICILEHGHGNVLTRLSPPQAVAELFARSFVPFHRHEYVESALNFLEDLVTRVPCYRYSFEPDGRAVDRILNFHD